MVCLEVDAEHSYIKNVNDLLQVLYDRDRIYKKYYVIGILVAVAVICILMLVMTIFDKDSPEHIKEMVGLEGLSTSLIVAVLFIASIPWLHAFLVHKKVMGQWADDNKLSK